MLKRFLAVTLLSTISTAFVSGSVRAEDMKLNACKDSNHISMALVKIGDKVKLDNTSIARRRLKLVWYYSDASYTKKVGWKKYQCDGRITRGGKTTRYSKVMLNEPCSGPNPA